MSRATTRYNLTVHLTVSTVTTLCYLSVILSIFSNTFFQCKDLIFPPYRMATDMKLNVTNSSGGVNLGNNTVEDTVNL